MALIHCNFFSEVLGISTAMYVILPDNAANPSGMKNDDGKHPTLYLLHGLSDDYTAWMRNTSIERYAADIGLAVVMPAVNRSFYTDMHYGYKYWTFISEELISKARSYFPLSAAREKNYTAGLSMGGYGALKLALRCPDRFSAAASLSGATDIVNAAKNRLFEEVSLIFGDAGSIEGTENDLFHLVDRVSVSGGCKPKIYQCCGTEDFLYADNIRFKESCEKSGLDYTYEEEPGVHEWGYWDMKIRKVLQWLPM